MGWASGSGLMSSIIHSANEYIVDFDKRIEFYCDIIKAFEGEDWDTQCDCEGEDKAFDEALNKLHPDWY